jgi:hypothetical protein
MVSYLVDFSIKAKGQFYEPMLGRDLNSRLLSIPITARGIAFRFVMSFYFGHDFLSYTGFVFLSRGYGNFFLGSGQFC